MFVSLHLVTSVYISTAISTLNNWHTHTHTFIRLRFVGDFFQFDEHFSVEQSQTGTTGGSRLIAQRSLDGPPTDERTTNPDGAKTATNRNEERGSTDERASRQPVTMKTTARAAVTSAIWNQIWLVAAMCAVCAFKVCRSFYCIPCVLDAISTCRVEFISFVSVLPPRLPRRRYHTSPRFDSTCHAVRSPRRHPPRFHRGIYSRPRRLRRRRWDASD